MGIDLRPSAAIDTSAVDRIAEMSLNTFLERTGKKLVENALPEDWVESSIRPKIRGMMDRYENFGERTGQSVFSIFKVQESHWLAYCSTNETLNKALRSHKSTLSETAQSRYSDITSYKGDISDLHIGVCGDDFPLSIKHLATVSGDLAKYARAIKVPLSVFTDIGRAWSLSRARDSKHELMYAGWATDVLEPILANLLLRAERLAEANEEALYILHYRNSKSPPKQGASGGAFHA